MAGYQAIGAINSYGNGYGNYQYNGQPQVNQYDTNNSTQVATMNSYSTPSNDVVKDKVSEENKKKRMKSALWITGGLLVTGAAAAILFASKGTGNSFWDKIKDGANDCWKGIKDTFSSNGAKKVVEKPVLDTVEMIQKNGKTTLRLPDATQSINGTATKVVSAASDLGVDNIFRGMADDASKIKGLNLVVNDNGVEKLVTWTKSGEIKCKIKGKIPQKQGCGVLKFEEQSDTFKKVVKETIEAVKNKNIETVNSNVLIKNVVYDSKIVDGTSCSYLFQGARKGSKTGTESVRRMLTDRFDVKSKKVQAMMDVDKNLAEAVVEAAPEGRHWYGPKIKPKYDAWKVRTATHTPKVKNWPAGTQILIEDNKISGIMQGGKVFGLDSENYHALHQQFPKAFDNVLNKKLDNAVRYLP